MPLPHSDVLHFLTGWSDRVSARGVGDRGSEAARERALQSAVASERLCGRPFEIVGAQQQPLVAAIVIVARPKAMRLSGFAGFQLLCNRLLQRVHDIHDVALFLVIILRGFRSLGL
jgi:hypothetical protein